MATFICEIQVFVCSQDACESTPIGDKCHSKGSTHSDYRTVSPYWVLPVYVELIRAVWADDGDRPLLF
jgi:hypothetical protein